MIVVLNILKIFECFLLCKLYYKGVNAFFVKLKVYCFSKHIQLNLFQAKNILFSKFFYCLFSGLNLFNMQTENLFFPTKCKGKEFQMKKDSYFIYFCSNHWDRLLIDKELIASLENIFRHNLFFRKEQR